MKYQIDVTVKNISHQCTSRHSCLDGDKQCLCEVEYNHENEILFVKPKDKVECNYRMPLGSSFTCLCPARKEIYTLYNI